MRKKKIGWLVAVIGLGQVAPMANPVLKLVGVRWTGDHYEELPHV
jgi:hypothetical protein